MGTYGDLGKSARDVVGKGSHFSILKLDVKTKTATGVEFNSGGSSNTDSGKVTGSLETKYKCADYGMTFTEKWSTDNSLAGYQMAFDSSKSALTKNNFAVGFSNGDFTLHTNVNDGQVFGGSVH